MFNYFVGYDVSQVPNDRATIEPTLITRSKFRNINILQSESELLKPICVTEAI